MGYLLCEKCGGYYELQKGENPDDFAECECGGRLSYSLRLDGLNESNNYKNLGKYNKDSIESYKKLKKTIKNYKNEKRSKFWFNRDNLSLKALLVGFIIGLIPLPFITSIIGGVFVGYIAGGSYKRGALHGFVAGIINLSTPIFLLSNPLGSGYDLLITLILVSIILSVIPEIIFSLLGTAVRKRMESRTSEIYKDPSRFKWWSNIGPKGQAVIIIAAYFVLLSLFAPVINSDFNYLSYNVSNATNYGVDEQLKAQALQLIEKDGYWSTYQKKLKNGQVNSSLDAYWFGNVEIYRDSVQISDFNNDSFIVHYRAVHHSRDSNSNIYYDALYLYTEKAVKKDGEWKLAGITEEPQFIMNESYKRWYSSKESVWYHESLNQ